jgi:hypothetical protein
MNNIKIKRSNHSWRRTCLFCGESFKFGDNQAFLYVDGQEVAPICHICRKTGSEGISEVIGRHCDALERRTSFLRGIMHSIKFPKKRIDY